MNDRHTVTTTSLASKKTTVTYPTQSYLPRAIWIHISQWVHLRDIFLGLSHVSRELRSVANGAIDHREVVDVPIGCEKRTEVENGCIKDITRRNPAPDAVVERLCKS